MLCLRLFNLDKTMIYKKFNQDFIRHYLDNVVCYSPESIKNTNEIQKLRSQIEPNTKHLPELVRLSIAYAFLDNLYSLLSKQEKRRYRLIKLYYFLTRKTSENTVFNDIALLMTEFHLSTRCSYGELKALEYEAINKLFVTQVQDYLDRLSGGSMKHIIVSKEHALSEYLKITNLEFLN